MDFYTMLDPVVNLLRSRQRITYRALKRQFDLDDAALEDLKEDFFFAHPHIVDEDGRGWCGGRSPSHCCSPFLCAILHGIGPHPEPAPLAYTPLYLAEKILTSRGILEGERKQVTVLFADLKGSMELLADRDPEEARQILILPGADDGRGAPLRRHGEPDHGRWHYGPVWGPRGA